MEGDDEEGGSASADVVADHSDHNGDHETAPTIKGLVEDASAVLIKVGLVRFAAKVAAHYEAVMVGKRGVKRSGGIAEEWLFDSEVLSDFELMALGMNRLEVRVLRAHIEEQKQRGTQRPTGEGAEITI